MRDQGPTAVREWKRYWPLVIAASVGHAFHALMGASIGLFMAPIGAAFGWTRTEVTLGYSLSAIILALGSPFVGVLVDRWGTRRLALPGLICTAAVIASFGLSTGVLWQWVVMWLAYGLFTLTVKTTIWSTAVAGVFTTSRGLALGAVLSGTALAQIISPPLTNWLIEGVGWRATFVWIGLGWGGAAFLLSLFFLFDVRDERRLARKGAADVAAIDLPGLTIEEAWRDPSLWRIGISTLLMMLFSIALVAHQFPILVAAGVSRDHAAWLVSLSGVAAIIGKVVTGLLLDRTNPNWVGGITLAGASLAFALLLEPFRTPWLIVLAMIINGYANGTKLQICGYLTTRYAGMRNFGAIFGVMASLIAVGGGLGPMLGAWIYDGWGNYTPLLIAGIVGCVISGALIFGLGRYPVWSDDGEARARTQP